MTKDKRYNTVKNLISGGHIKTFSEIFDTLPKSVVYRDLGMNNTRFNALLADVQLFVLKDVFRIASLIGVDEKQILEILLQEYNNQKKA